MIILGDRLKHLQTGEIGTYVEHVNEGRGYMVRLDSGRIIACDYDEFEKVEPDDE